MRDRRGGLDVSRTSCAKEYGILAVGWQFNSRSYTGMNCEMLDMGCGFCRTYTGKECGILTVGWKVVDLTLG